MSQKIRLLIVDDEVRFLKNLARRLDLRGFEVCTAETGEQALEAASAEEFDVALVDLKMPGINGDVVLERLKASHPFMEVIILTGHGSIDSAVSCTRMGSYSYLQKPCETDVLLETLKNAFRKRVARKLQLQQNQIDEMLRIATSESPLGILRRLKELEDKHS